MSKKTKIAKAKMTSIGAALEAGVTMTAKAPVVESVKTERLTGAQAQELGIPKSQAVKAAVKVKAKVESQQSIIHAQLVARARDNKIAVSEIPAILAEVRKVFPKGTATTGYVGYVATHKCTPSIEIVREKTVKAIVAKVEKILSKKAVKKAWKTAKASMNGAVPAVSPVIGGEALAAH
jgi:hypothetical protein